MTVPLKPQTVFVVDDDASVLRSVGRLLRSAGFNVVTFSSAEEFLEKQNPHMPGCLVINVTMPGLSGLELQEALVREGSRLPIIVFTGTDHVQVTTRATKSGAVAFLFKPCAPDQLLAAVEKALLQDRRLRQTRTDG